ncbi:MAG TPA: MlaD family protein [Solirubrobacteraceae bacterium]|nr:MlaD family protein [Solirubrobacteraceae bacterium]
MKPRTAPSALASPFVVGTLTLLIVGIAVYLSYIAENGLPFVPAYDVKVQVANANELAKNADVRIGGVRVGQVLTITPEPPSRTWAHPYAQLGLVLDRHLEPLSWNTHYRIRLASILGGEYLELIPGKRGAGVAGVPDGGTLTLNSKPRLSHELPFVDLDTALGTFGPSGQAALRNSLSDYGDVVAGRGAQLNDIIFSTARLLGPLDDVLRILADPRSHLGELVGGAAQTSQAVAAVAPELTSLLGSAATTFDALDRSALDQAIDQLPATESVASAELTRSLPTLSEAAQVVSELRPGAALLPAAARGFDQVVRVATPVFGPVPTLAARLRTALATVSSLARDRVSIQTFQALGSNDLATLGASTFVGLGAILRAIAPAQLACNVAGLWVHNFASAISEGDSTGAWLRTMPLTDSNESTETGTPASDLHLNIYPVEDQSQCQAGNEGYSGQQLVGHPPQTTTTVDNTAPPPGVLEDGEQAGLVP